MRLVGGCVLCVVLVGKRSAGGDKGPTGAAKTGSSELENKGFRHVTCRGKLLLVCVVVGLASVIDSWPDDCALLLFYYFIDFSKRRFSLSCHHIVELPSIQPSPSQSVSRVVRKRTKNSRLPFLRTIMILKHNTFVKAYEAKKNPASLLGGDLCSLISLTKTCLCFRYHSVMPFVSIVS